MELEEINKKIKDIDRSINILYEEQRELELKYNKVREQKLLEDKSILQENIWTLECDSKFKLYLIDNNKDGFKKLRSLYETDYDTFHYIFDNYSLYFNDSEMHLQADSNEQLLSFIKVHSLKIISKLSNKLDEINESLQELQISKDIIISLFNSTNGKDITKS
jgi:hypothetical protein